MANKRVQKAKTAVASFGLAFSHNGLLLRVGSLPVMRGGFGF